MIFTIHFGGFYIPLFLVQHPYIAYIGDPPVQHPSSDVRARSLRFQPNATRFGVVKNATGNEERQVYVRVAQIGTLPGNVDIMGFGCFWFP